VVCDQRLLIWPREALYLLRELRSDVCKIRDQLSELDRLRAIEAAARSYMACAHEGPWEQFTSSLASLEAALAAKGEK
jgi:hypothetical protein